METSKMANALLGKRSIVTTQIVGRTALVAMAITLGAACAPKAAPSACLQFGADMMPAFAGGLVRKDFRVANAWAVKSDQMIDSSGVKFPAYFLSADIIAPSGEAVVGTWATTDVSKAGLIYSVSPQAKKYSTWAQAAGPATTGITMDATGAKESVACVLNNRVGAAPKTS
jgi:hypothetical protein